MAITNLFSFLGYLLFDVRAEGTLVPSSWVTFCVMEQDDHRPFSSVGIRDLGKDTAWLFFDSSLPLLTLLTLL